MTVQRQREKRDLTPLSEFVHELAYRDTDYQRFLLAKIEEMHRKGIEVEMW